MLWVRKHSVQMPAPVTFVLAFWQSSFFMCLLSQQRSNIKVRELQNTNEYYLSHRNRGRREDCRKSNETPRRARKSMKETARFVIRSELWSLLAPSNAWRIFNTSDRRTWLGGTSFISDPLPDNENRVSTFAEQKKGTDCHTRRTKRTSVRNIKRQDNLTNWEMFHVLDLR